MPPSPRHPAPHHTRSPCGLSRRVMLCGLLLGVLAASAGCESMTRGILESLAKYGDGSGRTSAALGDTRSNYNHRIDGWRHNR